MVNPMEYERARLCEPRLRRAGQQAYLLGRQTMKQMLLMHPCEALGCFLKDGVGWPHAWGPCASGGESIGLIKLLYP